MRNLPPEFYGPWFVPIKGCDLKETNLIVFYRLGNALTSLSELERDMDTADQVLHLVEPAEWLKAFLRETDAKDKDSSPVPMPDSRLSAKSLLKLIDINDQQVRTQILNPLPADRLSAIWHLRETFEKDFEREQHNLSVFTVLPKGIYETRALIENAERKFLRAVLRVLPFPQSIYDLNQAGRCLAFEIPTACAFHTCRATEAVMLRYYELLKGPWTFKKRDWKIYVEQLSVAGAPAHITRRLEEIRAFDRNPYIHPEQNVNLDEAPILFELCTGVIFQMAQEMEKLTP
jgi:hypothetical protein